ncbi:unnamed protein product, partial [marine sediment metagenome]
PWLYHHGLHSKVKAEKVGTWDTVEQDEIGIFVEGELIKAHRYNAGVKILLEEGVLKTSSGSMRDLVQVGDDGHVEEWPIVEVSSTVTPAEWRMQPISPRAMVAIKSLQEVKGGTEMSLKDRIKALVDDAFTDDDDKDDADVKDKDKDTSSDGDDKDTDTDDTSDADDAKSLDIDELSTKVAQLLPLGKVVDAVKALDVVIAELSQRMVDVEGLVEGMARGDTERLKSMLQGDDWYQQLFVASREGKVMSDKDTTKVKSDNDAPASGQT